MDLQKMVRFLITNYHFDDEEYNQALIISIINGNRNSVRLLIKQLKNIDYDHCLMLAVKNHHFKIVKMMIQNGANTNRALKFAIRHNKLRLIKYLISCGANIENRSSLISISNNRQIINYLQNL